MIVAPDGLGGISLKPLKIPILYALISMPFAYELMAVSPGHGLSDLEQVAQVARLRGCDAWREKPEETETLNGGVLNSRN